MTRFQLAQVNIARPLEPLDTPRLAGFVEALEPINAIADAAIGFVWRLQTEDGDATALRPFPDDDRMLINMSVWDSIEAFGAFVYGPDHVAIMRRRREWFEPLRDVMTALWWVPFGHRPTPDEAVDRLDLLRAQGPTEAAFSLRSPFPPPDDAAIVDVREDWTCRV